MEINSKDLIIHVQYHTLLHSNLALFSTRLFYRLNFDLRFCQSDQFYLKKFIFQSLTMLKIIHNQKISKVFLRISEI